jgi:predicted transcriptional regulator
VAQRNPEVSDAELEVLKVLWEHGDVEAVLRQNKKRWVYTTVLTLLHRLQAKGYVKSDKRELAHVFSPVVTRERLVRQRLRDVADSLCEGAATPLLLALVEGQRFSSEELEQFRRLLDELEAKKRK